MSQFDPPQHLSPSSAALWRSVVPSRARSHGRLAAVLAALEARDRAEQARLSVDSGSLTTTTETTGAVHVHPLVKVERECRQQFLKAWSDLGFTFDAAIDGMPFERFVAKQSAQGGDDDEA